ncbi:hypothetical protein SK128_011846, partial [Halocaridina rubra]
AYAKHFVNARQEHRSSLSHNNLNIRGLELASQATKRCCVNQLYRYNRQSLYLIVQPVYTSISPIDYNQLDNVARDIKHTNN